VILSSLSLNVFSANEVVRVGQVADAVSLTGNVDYMITDETPFAMTGSVDFICFHLFYFWLHHKIMDFSSI